MNVLSLDCEYNQPSQKTIQIGAAVFKAKTGELLETLEILVNPGEPINPFITELTGITDEMVATGVSIQEAYQKLKKLHQKHKCFMNPIVWGSGVRNHSDLIYKEANPDEPNFMGFRVVDAKVLYQSMAMYHNMCVKGGLATVCRRLGIPFEGVAHTALADAINTFKVWHFIASKMPPR